MARKATITAAERFESLRSDRRRGASALAREAGDVLATAAVECRAERVDRLATDLAAWGDRLVLARPSMIPLHYAVGYTLQDLRDARVRRSGAPGLRERVVARAKEFAVLSRERMEVAAERAVKSLANARVLLTHSSSGSVDALFARMAPEGRRVIVTEARPLKEGVRTARALARRGFDVDLIVDAAAASCVPEADAAVLGADSVLRDGGVLNKVGSRSLARAARDAGVAVYVIADTFKFDPRPPESVTIEEMDPAEVLGRARPGVRVRNPYFDRVEPRDITAIVTERGPLRPSRVARAADALRPWFWA